jgi:hypothetical protein
VRPRAERARSLLGRLRQRREGVRWGASFAGQDPEPELVAGNGDGALSPAGARSEHPFVTVREPRHVRAVPTNADLKTARALDLFNASEHPRTVAGVARSLGSPFVTVRPSSTSGSVVTVVVGWELCWYRYEIDLADEAAGVRVSDQGDEIRDLDPADQLPNAAADQRGELHLAEV